MEACAYTDLQHSFSFTCSFVRTYHNKVEIELGQQYWWPNRNGANVIALVRVVEVMIKPVQILV